ncbi:MAG: hypothetical protein HKN75_10385 [Bacteroidia bacterium]|nr:hypothetical protein [Bacteroidia bacterium]
MSNPQRVTFAYLKTYKKKCENHFGLGYSQINELQDRIIVRTEQITN